MKCTSAQKNWSGVALSGGLHVVKTTCRTCALVNTTWACQAHDMHSMSSPEARTAVPAPGRGLLSGCIVLLLPTVHALTITASVLSVLRSSATGRGLVTGRIALLLPDQEAFLGGPPASRLCTTVQEIGDHLENALRLQVLQG